MVPMDDDEDDIEMEKSDPADDFDDVEGGPVLREEDEPKRRGRPPKNTPAAKKPGPAVTPKTVKAAAAPKPKADIEEAEVTKEVLEGLVSSIDRVIDTLGGTKEPKLQENVSTHLKAASVALTNAATWLHDALSKYRTPE